MLAYHILLSILQSNMARRAIKMFFLDVVAMSGESVYNSSERIPFRVSTSDNGDGSREHRHC